MLQWSLFGFKKRPEPEEVVLSPTSSSNINVSTLSSVGDIIKSVSEANLSGSASGKANTGAHNSASVSTGNVVSNSSSKSSDSHSKPTVTQCICCGTRLSVPNGLPYFKCSICDTFHDQSVKGVVGSSKHSRPVSPSAPLTLDLIESTIDKCKQLCPPNISYDSVHFAELENLLTRAFSSATSLNNSFPAGLDKSSYSKPNIDFSDLSAFYALISSLNSDIPVKIILTACLSLLKRPRIALNTHQSILFLLVILENPALYSSSIFSSTAAVVAASTANDHSRASHLACAEYTPTSIRSLGFQVLERCVGLLAYLNKDCKKYLLNWFSRSSISQFQPKVDILNAYISHRLTSYVRSSDDYEHGEQRLDKSTVASDNSGRALHHSISSSSLGQPGAASSRRASSGESTSRPVLFRLDRLRSRSTDSAGSASSATPHKKSQSPRIKSQMYGTDWRITIFTKLLSIMFTANLVSHKIPLSSFYNTMLDFADVNEDFDEWQHFGLGSGANGGKTASNTVSNSSKAAVAAASNSHKSTPKSPSNASSLRFCQYPFLLSLGAKTKILEYEARKQMEIKAHQEFFSSLDQKRPMNPFFNIRVHRDRILSDSFEAFDQNEDDLKKSLRVQFIGEQGIDAGGLRKEWFLLLFRAIFDPSRDAFIHDEESRYCWFNSNSSSPLTTYKLTGVALGLALYNSTILDINLPPVIFRRLLGASYSLQDFKEFRPSHGKNLQMLLDYDGNDFEQVFALNFCVIADGKNDNHLEIPLISNGRNIAVTKSNRNDYVRRVVHYYLEKSIKRQFEPFKQGFYNVVGGNALTLFQPQEIELLIRGSDERLDVDALRSVTKYQYWGPKGYDANNHIVIKWFWRYFKGLDFAEQRKLLMFVTGSDRIPATGISNLIFKVTKIGEDCQRFPTSHTCFNQLCLYAYSSRFKLVTMLSRAVNESSGFGIK